MMTELTVIGSIPNNSKADEAKPFFRMAVARVRAMGTVTIATRVAMSRLFVRASRAEPIWPAPRSMAKSCRYHVKLKLSEPERVAEAMKERTTMEANGPRMNSSVANE